MSACLYCEGRGTIVCIHYSDVADRFYHESCFSCGGTGYAPSKDTEMSVAPSKETEMSVAPNLHVFRGGYLFDVSFKDNAVWIHRETVTMKMSVKKAWCVPFLSGIRTLGIDREGWVLPVNAGNVICYNDLRETPELLWTLKGGQLVTWYQSETNRRWLYLIRVERDQKQKRVRVEYVEFSPDSRLVADDAPLVSDVWTLQTLDQRRLLLHCWI
jgi:hypothetical protein